jgi:hypothetical protein
MAGMLPFESPSVLDSADPLHFRWGYSQGTRTTSVRRKLK